MLDGSPDAVKTWLKELIIFFGAKNSLAFAEHFAYGQFDCTISEGMQRLKVHRCENRNRRMMMIQGDPNENPIEDATCKNRNSPLCRRTYDDSRRPDGMQKDRWCNV